MRMPAKTYNHATFFFNSRHTYLPRKPLEEYELLEGTD